jgi:hypothetical protein
MKLLSCALLLLLCSCASQSYFKSANEVSKKKAVLYLRNKPAMEGTLTIHYEYNFNGLGPVNVQRLNFIADGKTEEQNIEYTEVIGYSINKDYYALKNLYLFSTNRYHLLFAKRLTGEDSRIQLYELFESGLGNQTGETQYSYFISLSTYSQYETLNTKSDKLIPNFDLNMSSLVSDCPSLAEKIREKENGYFIPFFSFNTFKHREVMTKIIGEYNNCK